MRYTLENSILKVELDSFGAEIKSVFSKTTDREYLWNGDKKYWGRTSPVLFPFVGGLQNKEYHYNGKTYPMGQHGFARDMEHSLLNQDNTSIWFELLSNEFGKRLMESEKHRRLSNVFFHRRPSRFPLPNPWGSG